MKDINFSKVFIIAEAGDNHNGNLDLAFQLIDVAVEAGADAVKFQTFKSEKIVSPLAGKAEYQKKNTGEEESQLDMIKKLELSYDDFRKLKKYADSKGILFLSTPFEEESADFLDELVPIFKIPSGEITNLPLIKHIAKKGKPIIMSTGMATLGEIEEAINTIKSVSEQQIFLLHCTTNYPTPYEEVNLNAMLTLKNAFGLPVGYSDHTLGIEVPIAAVALGARVIEKHFTLDKNMPGPDHQASLEPEELKQMVQSIRNIELALGTNKKMPTLSEHEIMKIARKSLIIQRDIQPGEILSEKDIAIMRPGTGIEPKYYDIVIGMKIYKPIKKGEPLSWTHLKSN